MSFIDLSSELVGRIAALDPLLADTFINRAWKEIRRERQWSFLMEDCAIVCPTQVTAGAVAIVQFTNTVTCNVAASAALLAIALPPPLTLTAMQMRFGGSGNTSAVGQVYSITAVDQTNPAAIVLTLDRIVVETTNAVSGYQCYRCYVKPTIDDFRNWVSIVDMVNGWRLRLNRTSTEFDMRDPQRQSQGQAWWVGAFKGNPGSMPRPQYELWPHPTSGQTFYARFRRDGEEFTEQTDEQSPIIPDSMIMERALGWHAYRWAMENIGRYPALKGVNYVQLILASQASYKDRLLEAKRTDDEQELNSVWNRGHGLIHAGPGGGVFKGMVNFPIDSNFMQSHLINF